MAFDAETALWKINQSISSNQPMFIVVVVIVAINIFTFSNFFLKPLHSFAANFVCVFFAWTLAKFVISMVLSLFFMKLWLILYNF